MTKISVLDRLRLGVVEKRTTTRPNLKLLAPLISLLLFAAIALRLIAVTPFPAPDELQHVSYAAYLQQTGHLLPQFEKQKTLAVGDFSYWNERSNYLGHPSAFYLLIGLVLNRTLPPAQAIMLPRLVSALVLGFGVALALWAGYQSFQRDCTALLIFCLAFALCPELLSISRQVTNDSLAMLGGALAYWAGSSSEQRWSAPVAALGLLLALWAKLNAGLDVAMLLGLVFLLRKPLGPRWSVLLALGGLVGAVPYLLMLRTYGALVPVTAESVGHVAHMRSFDGYVPAFLLHLGYTWEFNQTDRWPIANVPDVLTALAFWAVMGCTTVGAWFARARLPDARAVLAIAAPLAFTAILLIHFSFSAANLGYSLPAASFRYELPLWPALAHTLAYAVTATHKIVHRAALTAIVAVALGFGWGCNGFALC